MSSCSFTMEQLVRSEWHSAESHASSWAALVPRTPIQSGYYHYNGMGTPEHPNVHCLGPWGSGTVVLGSMYRRCVPPEILPY
ncbi:hypothetical protein FKM82_029653 [Ascaphus truei]